VQASETVCFAIAHISESKCGRSGALAVQFGLEEDGGGELEFAAVGGGVAVVAEGGADAAEVGGGGCGSDDEGIGAAGCGA
jgi:hypothetical protein